MGLDLCSGESRQDRVGAWINRTHLACSIVMRCVISVPSRPIVIRSVVTDHFALVSLRTDWDGSQMVRVGTCWEKLRFKA